MLMGHQGLLQGKKKYRKTPNTASAKTKKLGSTIGFLESNSEVDSTLHKRKSTTFQYHMILQ